MSFSWACDCVYCAGQSRASPAEVKENIQSGPYGRILTPVANGNRGPALPPVGVVLRAKRLVLHASDVATPGAPGVSNGVRKVPAKLSAPHVRQDLLGPPAKKHKSAPCVPSPKGVVKTGSGKHRHTGNQSVPLPVTHLGSVHPHHNFARAFRRHRNGAAPSVDRSISTKWGRTHTLPQQIPSGHLPLDEMHPYSFQPSDHEMATRSIKKRSRKTRMHQSSAPAVPEKANKRPSNSLNHRGRFRHKSAPFDGLMDFATKVRCHIPIDSCTLHLLHCKCELLLCPELYNVVGGSNGFKALA